MIVLFGFNVIHSVFLPTRMADAECEVSKLTNRLTRTLAHHVRVTAVVSRVVLLRITIIYLATTGRSIGSHIYANLHLFVPCWGQAMGYLIKRDRTMVQENVIIFFNRY